MPQSPDRRDINGRAHVNRAWISEHMGIPIRQLWNLYRRRAENGHPQGERIAREDWFDEQQFRAWHAAWNERKRARRSRPQPEPGSPDELYDISAATRFLGYKNTSTIRTWVTAERHAGYFPDPDYIEDYPSGHIRRYWRRATLEAFSKRPPV